MDANDALNQFWSQRTGEVRAFLESQPRYQKLCEVAYIIERAVKKKGIEFASITFRPKKLASFCEKVVRKSYKKPFEQTTDLAGVRIVYLYATDCKRLESFIENEFMVVEKVDKIDKDDAERFGYGALHYLVKLKKKSSGVRYEDLKDLICEIQVRTILQDAWAIVAHHLNYKEESDVPVELRRKLNALSGLFETADSQFDLLKKDRVEYKKQVGQLIRTDSADALQHDINLDNLTAYLANRFPGRQQAESSDIAEFLGELKRFGYVKLKQLEDVISHASQAAVEFEKKYPPAVKSYEEPIYNQVGISRTCLSIADNKYLEGQNWGSTGKTQRREFAHLIKK